VAALARRLGAKLVFGSDAHDVGDLNDRQGAHRVLRGAGLTAAEIRGAFKESEELADLYK
jgi:histidinol phosphatase-like PHP family hydrolase